MSRESSLTLPLRERRSHGGDHRLQACLPKRDHVGVALHDDPALLLRDCVSREVEPVQDRRLVEELALGRVHVLAPQRIILVELARLEADDPAACVGQWEHQPAREVVVPAGIREAGIAELVPREALLLRLLREARPG